jgi:hypothetical protein
MITGTMACRMIDLRYVPGPSDEIDILVDCSRHVTDVGFIKAHRTARMPKVTWWMDTASPGAADDHAVAKPWWVDGDPLAPNARRWTIPIASVARACIDTVRLHSLSLTAAGDLSPWQRRDALRDVRALLCEAVQRKHCAVDDLRIELTNAARPGTALARRAIDDIGAGCRSAPECDLRDLVRSSRALPEPRWNQPLPGYPRLIPDACWPEARLVVEVNSWEWHRFGNAPEDTERRHALYASLGWTVLPVSPHRLRTNGAEVLREIVAAYRAGVGR